MINKVTRQTPHDLAPHDLAPTNDIRRDIVTTCGTCNGTGCASCDWTGTITIIED